MKQSPKSYLKGKIKSLSAFALSPAKFFPTRLTPKTEVSALIETLYPISTDKELIRLGPDSDSGYLLPNDLEGIKACFSPGVNFESDFEKDCADLGMQVFLADRSVDGPALQHDLFRFTKKFIGVTTNDEFMTLDSWVNSSVSEQDSELLLEIDIEGFEYEVFLSATDSLMKRLRIIVAEFHTLDQLWNRPFFNFASRTFEKLLQTHTCLHIHPNNGDEVIHKNGLSIPHVMEFTFLRNDRIKSRSYSNKFPHPLDCDNTDNPTIVLPSCWYKS